MIEAYLFERYGDEWEEIQEKAKIIYNTKYLKKTKRIDRYGLH